ncbi:MAG: hypothetical protein K2H71_06560, partial [Muribaculaceae bacterium]|nr:hypothetical protein [Muribaculaceae bacterium]
FSNLVYLCRNFIKRINMARPIKETPELFGKDAERFENIISRTKAASKTEKERARKAYEIMRSISNFQR